MKCCRWYENQKIKSFDSRRCLRSIVNTNLKHKCTISLQATVCSIMQAIIRQYLDSLKVCHDIGVPYSCTELLKILWWEKSWTTSNKEGSTLLWFFPEYFPWLPTPDCSWLRHCLQCVDTLLLFCLLAWLFMSFHLAVSSFLLSNYPKCFLTSAQALSAAEPLAVFMLIYVKPSHLQVCNVAQVVFMKHQ